MTIFAGDTMGIYMDLPIKLWPLGGLVWLNRTFHQQLHHPGLAQPTPIKKESSKFLVHSEYWHLFLSNKVPPTFMLNPEVFPNFMGIHFQTNPSGPSLPTPPSSLLAAQRCLRWRCVSQSKLGLVNVPTLGNFEHHLLIALGDAISPRVGWCLIGTFTNPCENWAHKHLDGLSDLTTQRIQRIRRIPIDIPFKVKISHDQPRLPGADTRIYQETPRSMKLNSRVGPNIFDSRPHFWCQQPAFTFGRNLPDLVNMGDARCTNGFVYKL